MVTTVSSVKPKWMSNYAPGYVGLTFQSDDFVSQGIAFFTRWERRSLPVSHALIVSGEDECVEALPQGVVRSNLHKYFDNPHCMIFFRQPADWTLDLGQRIVASAVKRVGHKYGYGLIVANALGNFAAGRLVRLATFGWSHRVVTKLFDSKRQEICSELVAEALNEQPELRGRGMLSRPAREITPQVICEEDIVLRL